MLARAWATLRTTLHRTLFLKQPMPDRPLTITMTPANSDEAEALVALRILASEISLARSIRACAHGLPVLESPVLESAAAMAASYYAKIDRQSGSQRFCNTSS